MSEIADNTLPVELAAEVKRYIAEGCPGDLNDYLDDRNVVHPAFRHHVLKPGEEFKPEVVGGCGPGFHGGWARAKDGHWWSTCLPDVY
jgi:hypothetical protein